MTKFGDTVREKLNEKNFIRGTKGQGWMLKTDLGVRSGVFDCGVWLTGGSGLYCAAASLKREE